MPVIAIKPKATIFQFIAAPPTQRSENVKLTSASHGATWVSNWQGNMPTKLHFSRPNSCSRRYLPVESNKTCPYILLCYSANIHSLWTPYARKSSWSMTTLRGMNVTNLSGLEETALQQGYLSGNSTLCCGPERWPWRGTCLFAQRVIQPHFSDEVPPRLCSHSAPYSWLFYLS